MRKNPNWLVDRFDPHLGHISSGKQSRYILYMHIEGNNYQEREEIKVQKTHILTATTSVEPRVALSEKNGKVKREQQSHKGKVWIFPTLATILVSVSDTLSNQSDLAYHDGDTQGYTGLNPSPTP